MPAIQEFSITAKNESESKKFCLGFVALAIVISFGLGGCSWTFPSKSSSNNTELRILEDDIQTGSIQVPGSSPLLKDLSEEDWRRAKSALNVALDPHGSTDRVVWDNPQTLARGTFASTGAPFVKNDDICRNFKATVGGQVETKSLEGTACRPSGGEWAIQDIKAAQPSKGGDEKSKKPEPVVKKI